MPTFLETLWANLYAQDCERRFAEYSTRVPPLEVSNMTPAQLQAIADDSAAFADEMVTRAPGASLAALQAAIAALKP